MKDVLEFLKEIYEEATELFFLKSSIVSHKSPNDVLSEADLRLNNFFILKINERYPEASIIAEESDNDNLTDNLTFVVDPLDGTCNYSLGLPLCGIQIAVFKNKECLLSFIGLPYFKEIYYAIKGEGAYLNDKRLEVNSVINSSEGILELSDFYEVNDDIEIKNQYLLVEELKPSFLKTRLFGAACIDFTNLATSKAQAYICYYRLIWDIAPGLLIAQEAGCLYSRINLKPYDYGNHSIVIANNKTNLDRVLNVARKFVK